MLDDIFPGQTEMARLMRAFDWASTPLGPVEQWPAALKTTVSTSLNCAFPIVMWWGPELTILYNDEYRPMLGPGKHPGALGKASAVVWAEIWDVIEPMLTRVMQRGEATRERDLMLHIDRGYPEEAYFSFSYSPIHTENGAVGGVFCPVIETTMKVIGERRLRTLRDLAATRQIAATQQAALNFAASVIGENSFDVPFALIYEIYELDDGQSTAALRSSAGIEAGSAAAPLTIDLRSPATDPWRLADVCRASHAVEITDLAERFADLPSGAWTKRPQKALALPVLLPGQEKPRAVVVAAVSPMRELDDEYRTFYTLIAGQIASALADAQAFESERHRAEQLAELDRAKTAFFSNVSHEFRTPLTLMIGPLHDLLEAPRDDMSADVAVSVDVALRNSQRLLKLVNTLLDFSRLEAGRFDASFEATDVSSLTLELASVFRSAVEKAGLRLVVDCAPVAGPAFVDPEMWEKIVLNLLSNALKFTPRGSITVALRQIDTRIELTVRDTGIGIAEADLGHVFERFHRLKNADARSYEGTGIGLALVQELVRLHGGTVSVTSATGAGSTFVVSIPTGSAHLPADRVGAPRQLASTALGAEPFVAEAMRWLAPDVPAARAVNQDLEDTDVARPSVAADAHVLVADDNGDMRAYLARILGPVCQVELAADGDAALKQIRERRPDLLIADVMMPGKDGFELTAAIRGDPELKSLPIILLSARAGPEARIDGLRAGADDYLIKPFGARELVARVTSQLQLSRLRAEATRARQGFEHEREQLLHDVQEASRLKDVFLATLSHELRTPLNAIVGYAHMLRTGMLPVDRRQSAVQTIERNAMSLSQIVEDILDISRIVTGKIRLHLQPVELSEVVRHAVEVIQPAAEAKDVRLESVVDPELPSVAGDADRLQQVLWNLLSNAVKFTPRGGVVSLWAGRVNSHVDLTVTDTGVGIGSDFMPHLFERFCQADAGISRTHGGLGLGLSIARQLAEMHGGSITASSAGIGKGASFRVSLPILISLTPADDSVTRPSTNSQSHFSEPFANLSDLHVLVVDDEPDALRLVAEVLGAAGARVTTARSADEATARLIHEIPDVLVADIGMPMVDGLTLIGRLRKHSDARIRALPAAALTAYARSDDRRRALDAGFSVHLAKPIDPSALVATVADLARHH